MMKHLLMFVAIAMVGCAGTPPPVRPPGPTSDHLQPIEPGCTWVYNWNGVRQTRVITGDEKVGRFACKVMETRTGNVVEKHWLRADKDGLKVYRMFSEERMIELDDPIVWIKYPAKVGDKWEFEEHYRGLLVNVAGSYEADEPIHVIAGKYTAARVRLVKTIQGTVVLDQVSWYAPSIGMVRQKTAYTESGKQKSWSVDLESFERK